MPCSQFSLHSAQVFKCNGRSGKLLLKVKNLNSEWVTSQVSNGSDCCDIMMSSWMLNSFLLLNTQCQLVWFLFSLWWWFPWIYTENFINPVGNITVKYSLNVLRWVRKSLWLWFDWSQSFLCSMRVFFFNFTGTLWLNWLPSAKVFFTRLHPFFFISWVNLTLQHSLLHSLRMFVCFMLYLNILEITGLKFSRP